MASEWRRLHPASVVINLLPRGFRVLRNTWPLFAAILVGSASTEAFALADAGIVWLLFLSVVVSTVAHYISLRYRFSDEALEIRSGILMRQRRLIVPSRVQNVELVQNPLHKWTGLVEVRIETASGGDVEGMLSALTREEADDLVAFLRKAPTSDAPEAPPEPKALFANSVSELLLLGAAQIRLGAAGALMFFILEFTSVTDPENAAGWLAAGIWGVVIVGTLSAAWLAGVIGTVLRNWGFLLLEGEDGLIAERGLFTRRRVVLRPSKVQVVMVDAPFLRRLAGLVSVKIETAAARAGGGGTSREATTVPAVARDQVEQVVRYALPDVDLGDRDSWRLADPKALIRREIAAGGAWVVALAAVIYLRGAAGLALLAPAAVHMGLIALDHHYQRWVVNGDFVGARRGYLYRRTWVVDRTKLQSVNASQGPLERRWGLGRVVVRVAGTWVRLPMMGWGEAQHLALKLSDRVG